MKRTTSYLIVGFCLVLSAHVQSIAATTATEFAGCYEVRALAAHPPDDSISIIPSRFQLSTDKSQFSKGSFKLKALGESVDPHVLQLFSWSLKQNRLHLAFSNGKWGYYGKLQPSGANEFAGNLKYFCDRLGHCDKHAVAITVRKADCP